MPSSTLITVTGYRHSHRGRQRRPIIRSTRTLRIRQGHGLDGSTAFTTSPLRAATILTRNHFHEVSRANGPKGQARKLGARKQRLCRRVPFRLGTLRLPRSRTMASSGYSWRGAESVPRVALCRITGYRRSHWGDQRRPIIRSIRTLRIRQGHGLDGSTAISTSPLRAASILTRNHFHELSRANGPKGQGRKTKQQDSAVLKSKSLWNPVSPAH